MRTARTIAVSVALTLGLLTAWQGAASAQGSTSYRWGSLFGQDLVNKPTVVGDLSGITAIAAGNSSSVALDATGHVWTWGLGTDFMLGNGHTTNHVASAVEVPGIPAAVAIAESYNTDVAITASGTVYGWGDAGQSLCTGNAKKVIKPERITSLSNVVMAAGASNHMLYLLADGTLEACGNNNVGQLGDGTLTTSYLPVKVTGLPSSPIVALSASQRDSAVLLADGQVWDWGVNTFGNLGDGTTTNSDVPVEVELPSAAQEVYEGGSTVRNGQSLALLSNGQVWGWGNNGEGQLGNGRKQRINDTPLLASALPAGTTFRYVATGGTTSFGLDSNGGVWSWGANGTGQIGHGVTGGEVHTPVKVLSNGSLISTTADNVAAVTSGPS